MDSEEIHVPAKKQRLEDDNRIDGFKEECDSLKPTRSPPLSKELSTETDVGIKEFVSTHEGFSGILKQRFSDFIVNEVDLNGTIVHLTDIEEPDCDQESQVSSAPVENVLTTEQLEDLRKLANEKDRNNEVLIEAGSDKSRRGLIHQCIRENFRQLGSATIDKNEIKYVKVTFGQNNDRRNKQSAWPQGRGKYCKFIMYKVNKDTMEAVGFLSKLLRMKANAFTYSGTKDRRAKTSQEVTVYRVTAKRLYALNKTLKGIHLGNFRYCDQPLKLGDLKGNHFNIILRNITGSSDQIEQAMKSLQESGFINYFGMQRFGTTSVPNHHIGRAILESNWMEAVELILKPRRGSPDWLGEARQTWWDTRDAEQALDKLGGRYCPEKQLLLGLKKFEENDLVSALSMIPRNTRLIYIHAYQSFIWNEMVSRRIKEWGLKVTVGDLVTKAKSMPELEDFETDGATDYQTRKHAIPEVVTNDNLADYSIHDVVLPLPGFDVIYPENQSSAWYEEILQEHDMDKSSFKHKVRDYSLPGGYRHVVIRPDNVAWSVVPYDDFTIPLMRSDLERLRGEEEPGVPATGGKLRALRVEFSLPSSTYATMAIRDVLKIDTSAASQAALNTS